MDKNKKLIASNMKILRKHLNYTQEAIAKSVGIERSAYANYESGEREFPYDVIEKLSSIYGCEPYSLFNEDFTIQKDVLICAFRMDNLEESDFKEVCKFRDIARSYLKINRLAYDKF